jgi:SNF2 family DNA or RNA helicase
VNNFHKGVRVGKPLIPLTALIRTEDSGKWARLREIAEVVAARQEKMLVFTQFREMTGPLATFLGQIFGRTGMVLHGQTAVENRKNLVRRFQQDEAVSFFVLSLRAGGRARVTHFDS